MEFTVCVTSFGRKDHLPGCLASLQDFPNVAVACYGADQDHERIVHSLLPEATVMWRPDDAGANKLWLDAVRLARSDWVVLLHDDDALSDDFLSALEPVRLPSNCAFVAWRGDVYRKTDGTWRENLVTIHPFGVHPAGVLSTETYISGCTTQGRDLAISPVNMLLRRDVAIAALEWCEIHLKDCYTRPTMLIGNDIALLLAHLYLESSFLYLDRSLVKFGTWSGSETAAYMAGKNPGLLPQYNAAREKLAQMPKRFHAST